MSTGDRKARIRRVLLTDAPAIAAIYAPYVRDTAITFETEPPDAGEMSDRIARIASRYPWLVLEAETADAHPLILGYAYASAFHERAAYRYSVSVTVYLRQDARGHGYGRQLYAELIRLLREAGFHRAYGLIALPNPASLALHQSMGFTQVGKYDESGYKFGTWHSVAAVQLALSGPEIPEKPDPQLAENTTFSDWRNGPFFDKAVRAELDAIAGDPDVIRERFSTSLAFGTAGLRGKMGAGTNRMNIYTVARATQALALYLLREKADSSTSIKVALGFDTRHHSEAFSRVTARVLAAHGITVLRFPAFIPTPLLAFSVTHLGCDAGIMVTASHNPPIYNGYKVYLADGTQISETAAAGILAIMQDDGQTGYDRLHMADYDAAVNAGRITELDDVPEEAYLAGVRELVDGIDPPAAHTNLGKDFRILYTPLNGTAGRQVLRLLREDGFADVHTVEVQMQPDPDFSTLSTPNPEFRAAFDLAEREAARIGADLVFATDPDADRFAAMVRDPSGAYRHLTGNQTGALLVRYILDALRENGRMPRKPAIIKTIVTDNLCVEIAKSFGVHVAETLTGFKNICGAIPELESDGYHYVMGFEESIGYAVGKLVRDKDGLSASLLLCRAAARCRREGRTLWDMLADLWKTHGYHGARPLNLEREGLDGKAQIATIMAAFRDRAPRRIGDAHLIRFEDLQSGMGQAFDAKTGDALAGSSLPLAFPRSNVLRYFFDDGSWYAVRPSGTEPKLKVYLYCVVRGQENTGPDDEAGTKALEERGEAALEVIYVAIQPLLEG